MCFYVLLYKAPKDLKLSSRKYHISVCDILSFDLLTLKSIRGFFTPYKPKGVVTKFKAKAQRLYRISIETKLLKDRQNVEIRDLDLPETQTEFQIAGYTDELSPCNLFIT